MEADIERASGTFVPASNPAQVPQTANSDPIEISIWRAMITSVTPQAKINRGAAAVNRERSGWGAKKPGVKIAIAIRRRISAARAESSRELRFIP
jgi:hypothetical protein